DRRSRRRVESSCGPRTPKLEPRTRRGTAVSEIFVSYDHATSTDRAQEITEALRSLGYTAWRDDDLPPHRAYAEVLQERVDQAKAVLVLWSKASVRSQWVRSEANRAREE